MVLKIGVFGSRWFGFRLNPRKWKGLLLFMVPLESQTHRAPNQQFTWSRDPRGRPRKNCCWLQWWSPRHSQWYNTYQLICVYINIYIYIYRHPWIEIMHMIVVHNSLHRYHMQYLAPMNFTKAQCCSNATWKDWSQQWECDLQRLKVQEMAEFRAKHQGCLEMYWKTWWKNTNIHGILWKNMVMLWI